jgi:hypothetical protein
MSKESFSIRPITGISTDPQQSLQTLVAATERLRKQNDRLEQHNSAEGYIQRQLTALKVRQLGRKS